jgi:hypothetical protein
MCELVEAHNDECDTWSKGLSIANLKDDSSRRELMKGASLGATPQKINFTFIPEDPTQSQLEEVD